MKTIFRIIAVALLAAFTFQATAQLGTNSSVAVGATGGVYTAPGLAGGTNNLLGNATVSYTNSIVLNVAQHRNVGLAVNFVAYPSTATNGNIVTSLKRSFDNGNNYETTAYATFTDALPTAVQWAAGTTNWTYLHDLTDLTNATQVQITSVQNTGGGTAWVTNALWEFNINNDTIWVTPAQH